MTEQEARTKWCPFVRALVVVNSKTFHGPVNRVAGAYLEPEDYETLTRCCASGCMMWREITPGGDKGYCGLAGPALP